MQTLSLSTITSLHRRCSLYVRLYIYTIEMSWDGFSNKKKFLLHYINIIDCLLCVCTIVQESIRFSLDIPVETQRNRIYTYTNTQMNREETCNKMYVCCVMFSGYRCNNPHTSHFIHIFPYNTSILVSLYKIND